MLNRHNKLHQSSPSSKKDKLAGKRSHVPEQPAPSAHLPHQDHHAAASRSAPPATGVAVASSAAEVGSFHAASDLPGMLPQSHPQTAVGTYPEGIGPTQTSGRPEWPQSVSQVSPASLLSTGPTPGMSGGAAASSHIMQRIPARSDDPLQLQPDADGSLPAAAQHLQGHAQLGLSSPASSGPAASRKSPAVRAGEALAQSSLQHGNSPSGEGQEPPRKQHTVAVAGAQAEQTAAELLGADQARRPRRKSKNWTKASIAMQAMRRFVRAGEQGRARKSLEG